MSMNINIPNKQNTRRTAACTRSTPASPPAAPRRSRKGTNGVSTNGVTANLMFFDRGTFWVLHS